MRPTTTIGAFLIGLLVLLALPPREARAQGGALCLDVVAPAGVGVEDISAVAARWNSQRGQPGYSATLDIDANSAIALGDVQRVAAQWGQGCPGWLHHLHKARYLADLPLLAENSAWSDGGWKHSRYMVKNDVIGHSEDPALPWYTPEGHAAAQNGNVAVSSSTDATDEGMIDLWLTGPFHQVGIIDPRLAQTGFGAYREAIGTWQTGATLDVLRGLGSLPATVTYPIRFPEAGKTSPYSRYTGGEYPDPLSACAGYTIPSGPPIILQLTATPTVSAFSFARGATALPACLYTETTYTNANASAQSLGRSVLAARHAIVLIPRDPLTAGTHTVSITANGTTHSWSFTATGTVLKGDAAPAQSGEPPLPKE